MRVRNCAITQVKKQHLTQSIITSASYPSTCSSVASCNEPTSTTDANGNTTNYTYDATTGLITSKTLPAPSGTIRPKVVYSYTTGTAWYLNSSGAIAAGDPITVLASTSTCAAGSSCAGTANELKQIATYQSGSASAPSNLLPASQTIEAGNGAVAQTQHFGYDIYGILTSIDGPLAGTADTTTYRYDLAQNRIGEISADPDGSGSQLGRALRTTYNGAGDVAEQELGTVTGTSDAAWAAFSSKQQLVSTYNAADNKTRDVVTSGGATYGVTDYSYDVDGRLDCTAVRMNPAAWGTVTAACTAQAAGSAGPDRITRNGYDAVGRVHTVTSAYGTTDASTDTTNYTPDGQVGSVVDGKNNTTTYGYDGFDRLSTTTYPGGSYEQLGYDSNGNVTSRRLRDAQSIIYTYDHLNRLTNKNLPGTEPDVTYGYDLLGRPTSVTEAGNALSFSYDALGHLLTETGPQGTLTSTWDAAGRRTKLQWPDAFYVIYDYDTLGEMTKVRENGAASGVGLLASYSYDDLGNRVGATYGNGTTSTWTPDPVSRLSTLVQNLAGTNADLTRTFTYNPASQIASMTSSNDAYAWNAAVNVSRSYTTNGLNQYTASGGVALGYDARGNLTSSGATTYGYSSENLMTSGPGGTSLSYDPLMRLYQVSNASTTTRFAYDGLEMVAEYNSANALQHRYVFGPGTDDPIVQYDGTGTASRSWLVADERGSIIALANSSGAETAINSYDEYGIPGTANVGRFQYTGQEWIPELGLYYYKARMYSPSLGRFMQTDPIGYADGLNWYNYVGSDPINYVDPMGTQETSPPITVIGQRTGCDGIRINGVCLPTSEAQKILNQLSDTPGAGSDVKTGDIVVVAKKPQNTKPRPCGPSNRVAAVGEKLAGYLTDGADAVAFYAAVTGNEEIAGPAEALALIGSGIKGGIQLANGDYRGAAITAGSTIVGGALTRLLPKSVSPLNAASERFNKATASAFGKAGEKSSEAVAEPLVCPE